MGKYYYGVVMVLVSAFGFALMPTFAKLAYKNGVTVTTLLFFRFILAATVFFCCLLIKKKPIRLNKRNLLNLFLLGAVCYTLQSAFYFSSVKYIPASLAVLITYTHPTIIAIISSFWDHEPITRNIALALISSFIGLTLMLGTTLGELSGLGVILATGSSLVYAIYVVFSNKVLKEVPSLTATAFIALFSGLGFLFFGTCTNNLNFSFQPTAWPWLLGLAVFSTVLAMLTFFQGLKILGPTKSTLLSTAEPVFGVIVAMVLFTEKLTALQFLGAIGVITGAMIAVYAKDKQEKPKPTPTNTAS